MVVAREPFFLGEETWIDEGHGRQRAGRRVGDELLVGREIGRYLAPHSQRNETSEK